MVALEEEKSAEEVYLVFMYLLLTERSEATVKAASLSGRKERWIKKNEWIV